MHFFVFHHGGEQLGESVMDYGPVRAGVLQPVPKLAIQNETLPDPL